jgi:hypothetical protein
MFFGVGRSVPHHIIQINQPTWCNSFTCLLLDVYVQLNMFRAPPRPSSRAYNCINILWIYCWSVVVAVLLVAVWSVIHNWSDHDQQRCYHHAPTVVVWSVIHNRPDHDKQRCYHHAPTVVVWSVIHNRPDHDQQRCYHHAPTVGSGRLYITDQTTTNSAATTTLQR